MKYSNVKNAHIVPRSYLDGFSDEGSIAVHVDHSPEALIRGVENVGTRRRFYRRTRPDGTEIDDVEWSLSKIEGHAAPVLERLVDEWPSIPLSDKAAVAQLFASQLLRVPLWMDWYSTQTREHVAEYRSSVEGRTIDTTAIDAFEAHLLADSTRLTQMLVMGFKLMPVLASMHWTLVEFRKPILATSDQPVVLWPLDAWSRAPTKTPPTIGVLHTIEIRAPITPNHLIVMSWADLPDEEAARRYGSRHHAASVNAFTIAQSDRQWFHLPGTNPPRSRGSLCPVSPELVPGYNAAVARASGRRARASQVANASIGKNIIDEAAIQQQAREVEIVTVSRGR